MRERDTKPPENAPEQAPVQATAAKAEAEVSVNTDADPEAEMTASATAEKAIFDWGTENGHEGLDLEALRNYAPHEMLAEYDDAVEAEAAEKSEADAAAMAAEKPEED